MDTIASTHDRSPFEPRPPRRLDIAWRPSPDRLARRVTVALAGGATVGDLAAAVDPALRGGLLIDGTTFCASEPLPPLVRGVEVGPYTLAPVAGERPMWRWRTGPDAASVQPLPPGRWLVGSSSRADIRSAVGLAPVEAELESSGTSLVVVPMRGGDRTTLTPGTSVRVGELVAEVALSARCAPTTATPVSRDAVWHRPPRAPAPAPHTPMKARPRADGPPALPVPVASLVAAGVTGLALAMVMGRPAIALAGLVGALATAVPAVVQRVRRARSRRRDAKAEVLEARALVAVAAAVADEEACRRRDRVDVVGAVGIALALPAEPASARLWERRPHHHDAWDVVVGWGDVAWQVPADGPLPDAVLVATGVTLAGVPVTVRLAPGEVLGVVGPVEHARALARALVVQLAVAHGPADMGVTAPPEWEWAGWLPHIHSGAPALEVTEGKTAGDWVVVVTESSGHLPASVTTAVELTGAHATVRDVRSGHVLAAEVKWAGLSLETADLVARALAPRRDSEAPSAAGLPTGLELADVLGPADAAWVRKRWQLRGHPCAPIGVDANGTALIDLDRDGPHALVVGTTG
ncbi:MAG TPA: hypothetical protein VF855_09590, partial [Acidimicrobiales bacterium]